MAPGLLSPLLTTGEAGEDCLNSSNGLLAVDEGGEDARGDLDTLDDARESRDWIRVLADSAGEARQSAGSSAVWGGARIERGSGAREDSEDEEGWVINTWTSWHTWELRSSRSDRQSDKKREDEALGCHFSLPCGKNGLACRKLISSTVIN